MTEPALVVENADAAGRVIVLCDHATNIVPVSVAGGDLGIPSADMARHIAWDVGALGVSRVLARALDGALLHTLFSRLVIDPNRGEDDPTLIMRLYDGTIIPGNRHVDAAERDRRLAAFHRPYHIAIDAQIDRVLARGQVPVLVSIHSYTPQLRGRPLRPWQVGILWDDDARLAVPLINALRAWPDTLVGDNEPYSGNLQGDTMYRHGTQRGLPHVLIEIRNDLIGTPETQAHWAARLADPLRDIIATLQQEDSTHG